MIGKKQMVLMLLRLCLREKVAGCQSKILEQATEHQAKEASLLDQLYNAQKQQRDVVAMCQGGYLMSIIL